MISYGSGNSMGGTGGAGDRDPGGDAVLGEAGDEVVQHGSFTAPEMRAAGNVEPETVRGALAAVIGGGEGG